jgi:Protein of unknown function (DUF2384)
VPTSACIARTLSVRLRPTPIVAKGCKSSARRARVQRTAAIGLSAWLERRAAPAGEHAARLSELIAAVERLELSTKREAIPQWLRRKVPALDGKTPLQTLAGGGYERVAGFAEDLIYPTFT